MKPGRTLSARFCQDYPDCLFPRKATAAPPTTRFSDQCLEWYQKVGPMLNRVQVRITANDGGWGNLDLSRESLQPGSSLGKLVTG